MLVAGNVAFLSADAGRVARGTAGKEVQLRIDLAGGNGIKPLFTAVITYFPLY